jgi:large subunit ribosomal protein L6
MLKKKKISPSLLKTFLKKRQQPPFSHNIKTLLLGSSIGYTRKLKFNGIGIRVDKVTAEVLYLRLGFSHIVCLEIPSSVAISSPNRGTLILSCPDNLLLTQFISRIKSKKPLNSYKGFGICDFKEKLVLKEFKKK